MLSACGRTIRRSHDAAIEFAGLHRLVEAVRAFQVQAEELDRATDAVAARDDDAPRRPREAERRAREGRAGVLARRGLAGPPLVQARGLRSRLDHRLRLPGRCRRSARPSRTTTPRELAADLPLTVERIKKATAALESARERAAALTAH